jgi:hypothetical protein
VKNILARTDSITLLHGRDRDSDGIYYTIGMRSRFVHICVAREVIQGQGNLRSQAQETLN